MRCLLCASRFRDCRDIGMEHTSGLIAFGRWAWSLDGVNPSVDRWMVGFLGLFLVFPSDIHFGRCEISVKINHIPIKATLSKRDIYGYSKILNSPWALRIVPIWCKVPREPLTICSTFGTPSGDRDRGPPGTAGKWSPPATSRRWWWPKCQRVPFLQSCSHHWRRLTVKGWMVPQ